MKAANWKDVVELVGLAAIFASLVFVGLQMRQAQEIALAEMMWTHMTAEMESRSGVYDYPEVWAKGNAGETLSPNETNCRVCNTSTSKQMRIMGNYTFIH